MSRSDSTVAAGSRVLALSGGVGGAKLALGLARILEPAALTVVANTGDDFEHFDLHVSPDLDTLMYTLAGISNQETGWGRADETWRFMEAIEAFGGEAWFRLGDADLATHVERTRRLRRGDTLTAITDHLRRTLGVGPRLLPMSDDAVRTLVHTADGTLAFQHYFVKQRCRPAVTGFDFAGIAAARPNPAFMDLLRGSKLGAVIICPSNPFISIDPVLKLPGVMEELRRCAAPVIAVTPIIGDNAVKGPTAKMMRELGMPTTAVAVARHYGDLLDGFVLDQQDARSTDTLSLPVAVAQTLMHSLADRDDLARTVLDFAASLRRHA